MYYCCFWQPLLWLLHCRCCFGFGLCTFCVCDRPCRRNCRMVDDSRLRYDFASSNCHTSCLGLGYFRCSFCHCCLGRSYSSCYFCYFDHGYQCCQCFGCYRCYSSHDYRCCCLCYFVCCSWPSLKMLDVIGVKKNRCRGELKRISVPDDKRQSAGRCLERNLLLCR